MKEEFFVAAIVLIVGLCVGIEFGLGMGKSLMFKEAEAKGFAHYECKSDQCEWKWNK